MKSRCWNSGWDLRETLRKEIMDRFSRVSGSWRGGKGGGLEEGRRPGRRWRKGW